MEVYQLLTGLGFLVFPSVECPQVKLIGGTDTQSFYKSNPKYF